jgi:hypothetical protein
MNKKYETIHVFYIDNKNDIVRIRNHRTGEAEDFYNIHIMEIVNKCNQEGYKTIFVKRFGYIDCEFLMEKELIE